MADTVIHVENLGKKYILEHQQKGNSRYVALRDVIADGAKSVVRRLRHPGKRRPNPNQEEFWALKDVSFEVKQGEVVGIIGRNGAGKSTLLKILTRITEPTTGRIRLRGRVASLLEVGTGFHPELTGRENIFLNGAILGMSRAEINRKFDEIVEFAEVSRFLDTPVKRYSSGMYVRLAFAVAAHLEPEILVVDEVLAVGDAAFQKKCLGKMGDVAKQEGRTVLFVSHNMAAVESLCRKGIYLQKGKVQYIGTQTEAITRYTTNSSEVTSSLEDRKDRRGTGELKIIGFDVRDSGGNSLDIVRSGQDIDIYFFYKSNHQTPIEKLIISLAVKTQLEIPVFLHHNRLTKQSLSAEAKEGAFILRIKKIPLPSATYLITYSIDQESRHIDSINNAFELRVIDGDFFGSGEVPPISHGVCLIDGDWRTENFFSHKVSL